MKKVECVVLNPDAYEKNHAAQRQLAAWLVRYGIERGTIKNPSERSSADDDQKEEKVLYMRCGSDGQKLCSGL